MSLFNGGVMPELPEVETIKEELGRLVVGKVIKDIEINLAKQVKNAKTFFISKVRSFRVVGIRRRAKLLIVELSNKYNLAFHLKMTGQLIFKGLKGDKRLKGEKGEEVYGGGGHLIRQDLKDLPNKYSHVIFNFSDGTKLFFNDTRQFGWVKLVNKKELEKIESEYGLEPLAIRDYREFGELFKGKKSAIKPLLMNQKLIAGVGNIYAAETLFAVHISPLRRASEIKDKEWQLLFNSLKKILKLAIAKKGTSADDYVDAFGRQGSMEPYLKVYGREGKKCVRCGKTLIKIKQGARSTVYCGGCQT